MNKKNKKNHKHDACKLNNFIYTDLFINVFLNKLWALKDIQNFYNSFALDHLQMLNLKIKC